MIFRAMWPARYVAEDGRSIYHTVRTGPVEVFITDTRYEKNHRTPAIFGAVQLRWLNAGSCPSGLWAARGGHRTGEVTAGSAVARHAVRHSGRRPGEGRGQWAQRNGETAAAAVRASSSVRSSAASCGCWPRTLSCSSGSLRVS